MPSSSLEAVLFPLALAAALGGACTCEGPATTGKLKPEGERCAKDDECETALCAGIRGDPAVCRRQCSTVCRDAEVCTAFSVGAGGKIRAGCVPERPGLCRPCRVNADCPYDADVCMSVGGARFCGRDCSYDDACPYGYVCSDGDDAEGLPATRQCLPKSGTCACIPDNAGQTRPCAVSNSFGTCLGEETCDRDLGFARCTARVPAQEVCNGQDDDCDGVPDDNIPDVECGVGECKRKVEGCVAGAPGDCVPGTAQPELCNNKDDNCDGRVDETFDLNSDVKNCGFCGNECYVRNGVADCRNRACVVAACNGGFKDCDGRPENGCERDVEADPDNCGACDFQCNLPHAVQKCAGGQCAIASCLENWWNVDKEVPTPTGCEYPCVPTNGGVEVCDNIDNDCNGTVDDGILKDTDPMNCGGCNIRCPSRPNTTATLCIQGHCGFVCQDPFRDCDGDLVNGCETNSSTDPVHCGSCTHPACPAGPNARASCANGVCGLTCDPGWADCDAGQPGCERLIKTLAVTPPTCGPVTDLSPPASWTDGNGAQTDNGIAADGAPNPPQLVQSTALNAIFSEGTYKIRLLETKDTCTPISANIRLTPPAGLAFDLYVSSAALTGTPDSCGSRMVGVFSASPPGNVVSVDLCGCDDCWSAPLIGASPCGGNSGVDVYIEIAYRSGAACGNWELTVTGNAAASACAPGGSQCPLYDNPFCL